MQIEKPIASESTHWYLKDGSPQYTIIGANGKERNATLRDARKLGLFPSVSGVLKVAANPGLDKWKRDNLLLAALTLPRVEGETPEQLAKRIEEDANEQGKVARELGTAIHESLEKWYLNYEYNGPHEVYIDAVSQAIATHFECEDINWSAEKSFASPLGYGGKVDLHADGIVIDFKTSAFDDADKKEGYDEYIMQLVAYAHGLGMEPGFRCANVLVSTSKPGLVKIIEYTEKEMEVAWKKFQCLLTYWQLDKQYFPGEQ